MQLFSTLTKAVDTWTHIGDKLYRNKYTHLSEYSTADMELPDTEGQVHSLHYAILYKGHEYHQIFISLRTIGTCGYLGMTI